MISYRGISMLLKGTQHVLIYPLVNEQQTMENHHFEWLNQRTKWSFSIAMLVYQRVVEMRWIYYQYMDILPKYDYVQCMEK